MILIRNIALNYGAREVIKNFSCEIPAGSIAALVGENGVGKSTLLAAISGDIKLSEGEINLFGKAIRDHSLRELADIRSVAVQSHYYWAPYSVFEILRLGNESIASERIRDIAHQIGLNGFLNQSITTLSGGQLQRVEIARAFIRPSPLVLLDEPFASQDINSISELKKFFLAEKTAGRTIVLVAHVRGEDLEWCDQIIEVKG